MKCDCLIVDVTYSFEQSEYFINEDGGAIEICILQSGDSITDLTVIASPQESTAKGMPVLCVLLTLAK